MDSLKKFFADLAKRPESTRELAAIAGLSQKGAWLYKAGKIKEPSWRVVETLKAYMASRPLRQQRKAESRRGC
jgi:hypothetical protein